jgi:glycerate 2-kinase
LCFCLISGGGSALLPAPVKGVTLADKLAVTRFLSAAGANIVELNAVRKRLSRIKGGGLARACRAGRLIVLVISDVLGDPLDVIASGPTVEDRAAAEQALAVLEKFAAREGGVPERVFEVLRSGTASEPNGAAATRDAASGCEVRNLVIGNNAVAVDAAGMEAERLGYSHALHASHEPEGPAEEIGRHLAEMAVRMRGEAGPDCLITGGEPTVALAAEPLRGLGGRNQQLALAACEILQSQGGGEGIVLLSGGTDGEDGPTDAAGAIVDAELIAAARLRGLSPADFLRRNDAYHFFGPLGGLLKTGPTHTNVCDLRVVVVDRPR